MAATRGRSSGKRRGESSAPMNYEAYGLPRDTKPSPILTPPPLYPSVDSKALPLKITEVNQYLLALKQDFRQSLVSSVYYIRPEKEKPKIERYSDKYENIANKNVNNECDVKFDWRLFPPELHSHKSKPTEKPKKPKRVQKLLSDLPVDDNEDKQSEKSDDEKQSNSDVDENEVEGDKELEDIEEGTDYTFSYFDNGENYLEESDDNMDEGPTY